MEETIKTKVLGRVGLDKLSVYFKPSTNEQVSNRPKGGPLISLPALGLSE
jgi:hypothetical protein